MVQLIIVRGKNFRVELRRKVFHRGLTPISEITKTNGLRRLPDKCLMDPYPLGLRMLITSIINIC